MNIGIVKSSEIKKNRDGEQDQILLQVEISDADDIQTVELITHAGNDSRPPKGSRVIIVDVGSAYKLGIAVDDLIVPSVNEGEKKLYSSDAGVIKAFIDFLKNGILELNGNSKGVARLDDTTSLQMSGIDIQGLAAALLTTGAFLPSGNPPVPAANPLQFTNGKITSASDMVKTA